MPALTFGAVITDRVTQSASAVGAKQTWLLWVFVTTITNNRVFWGGKPDASNNSVFNLKIRTGGEVQLVITGTISGDYRTSTAPLAATSNWRRIAIVYDSTLTTPNQTKFYTGNEVPTAALVTNATSLATDVTIPATQSGTGTTWGNTQLAGAYTIPIQGRMSFVATFPDALTLAQCQSWFANPRNNISGIIADDFKRLGNEGATTQQDYSGNGFTGTTTGATASAGPVLCEFTKRKKPLSRSL